MRYCIVGFLLLGMLSCNQVNSSGQKIASDSVYVYEPVGWSMKIPADYELLSKEEEIRLQNKGLKSIEESVGEKIEVDPVSELLSFRKDRSNVFLSNVQVIDSVDLPFYEETLDGLVEIMTTAYKDKGMNVEHKRGRENIDGQEFITDEFILSNPDRNFKLTQLMFSRLFGNIALTATITWANEKYGEEMLSNWRSSKFSRK